ncbi:ferric reductase-like transmembrane domain-containing protein [Flavisolibacter nicotianae]|uniref:ferric reductase-like transmembrane domain-containing protein n=1 Tax=Flavisolibacter nicotianae TaxID=2364882 RepID=UPI000EAED684|nr:ferric reductase-like transmembrane domain-containing protein [Flavisolibacter nicotianae]
MNVLDLSATLGLMATISLTLNMLLGMLLGTAYRKSRLWKKLPPGLRRIRLFTLHNWTAYLSLTLVLLHPVLLLFDASTKFKAIDLVFPLHAPTQRWAVAVGTVSLFIVVGIVLSSQKALRVKLGYRGWKNLHLLSYAAAILFFVHGIALDPLLKDRPVDFLDAEKAVSELCALVLLAATLLRFRYYRRTAKAGHHK